MSREAYWAPHVTVAAVIEGDGRYLMVEECPADCGTTVFNQPAGHLEPSESLLTAVIREVREETGHDFIPSALVGIYQWRAPHNDESFLRLSFCGRVSNQPPATNLDPEILGCHWLNWSELGALAAAGRLRSPLVMRGLHDYRAGHRHDLRLLQQLGSAPP